MQGPPVHQWCATMQPMLRASTRTSSISAWGIHRIIDSRYEGTSRRVAGVAMAKALSGRATGRSRAQRSHQTGSFCDRLPAHLLEGYAAYVLKTDSGARRRNPKADRGALRERACPT